MIDAVVSPRFATYTHVYLLSIGIDPKLVFDAANIEFSANTEYDKPLMPSQIARLFNVAAQISGDNCYGFNMGANFRYESAGLSILTMTSAPNLEKGINALIHYGKHIDSAIQQELHRSGETFTYNYKLITTENLPLQHFHEYISMLLFKTLSTNTQKPIAPKYVSFSHASTVTAVQIAPFFGTSDIRFNQQANGVTFDNKVLAMPFVTANKLLHSLLINALKTYISDETAGDYTDVVCRELIRMTSRELPSIESVASSLSVSTRTLRRKLTEEGHSFQEVKHLALERKSKNMLQYTKLSLAEIAYELGYADVSSFGRAFRMWTGVTPQNFRKAAQQESSTRSAEALDIIDTR